jgi:hypothetical protein
VPGSAPRGGSRRLRPPLRFQVLPVSFEIHADDEAVRRQLEFLVQSAAQPEAPSLSITYGVTRRGNGFEIAREGTTIDTQCDAYGVYNAISRRVHRDVLAALPDAALLWALTGSWRGERFIVVGESVWDRSRLALHLMSRGAEVEGDDLAFLHDGTLTPYPRPLRVCGLDAPLPPGAPPRDELPFLAGYNALTGSWALDLTRLGIAWRINRGSVDRIVLLETNYGGQTRIRPMPRHETARILLSNCAPRQNVAETLRSIARLTNGADCCLLNLGALADLGDFWPPDWRDTVRHDTASRRAHGRDGRHGVPGRSGA